MRGFAAGARVDSSAALAMHTVSRQAGVFAAEDLDYYALAIRYNSAMNTVINRNPNILGGTPVFMGTRVPVESLFDYLRNGHTIDYFLEQFPSVRREQLEALLDEAKAKTLSREAIA